MYLGFQGLRGVAQVLPFGASRVVGGALGLAAYGILGAQRRLTEDHLAYAFGESLTPSQRRRVARRVFTNLGRSAVEWLQLPRLSSNDLQRLVASDGVKHLRRAIKQGRGAILLTAHFGNWEVIPPYIISLGFKGGVLARRLRYPEYESFIVSMRGAKGIPTFTRGSLKEVATLLRANQIIGMLPDQDIDSVDGVFVNFFGHPAYTPIGPAALSLMTGSPILPCFLIREGAGFRLVIEPPLSAPQAADRTQALTLLTQAWSAVIESYVRRYPDHWVWMHRRWKTQPAQNAQGSGLRAQGISPEPRAQNPQPLHPAVSLLLVACCWLLAAAIGGCAKPAPPTSKTAPATEQTTAEADRQMSGFTLTGYEVDGTKRWELEGTGASAEREIVTIRHPNAKSYDPERTAYLTASVAQVNQQNRHVRMEHEVTIHTSDGLWFAAPVLYWIPDQNQVATDQPVRMETDHMLVYGRGFRALTQLKHATILEDVELVLNPSDHEAQGAAAPGQPFAQAGADKHVTITCDGPLTFDYENNIATFEQRVHVKDPNGDLYSDKLIAYLNQATHTIRYAEAIGRVRIEQHQNTAHSDRAVYEPAIGKITLVGKPSLVVYPSEGHETPTLAFGGLTTTPDARIAAPAPEVH